MHLLRHLCCIVLILTGISARAVTYSSVDQIPNPHTADIHNYVSDPDGYLSPDDITEINIIAKVLEDSTNVQVAIVVLDSIDDMRTSAFDLSVKIFNTWGIGDAQTNTGVLILIGMRSHDVQMRTGDGVEGILTDLECDRILYDETTPYLRSGGVGFAIKSALLEITKLCYAPENRAQLLLGYRPIDTTPYGAYFGMFVCLIVILVQCWKIFRSPKCPVCGKRMWIDHDTIVKPHTFRETGEGIHHYVCRRHPKEKKDVDYTIWKKFAVTQFTLWVLLKFLEALLRGGGRGSGGGSRGGSYGGGHTSGGGAGGKW